MLSNQQILFIQEKLKSSGVQSTLNSEILDHVCTSIEHKMEGGLSFQSAVSAHFSLSDINNLRKLNRKLKFIHYQKYMNLKIIVFLLIILSLVLFINLNKSSDSNRTNSETTPVKVTSSHFSKYAVTYSEPPSIWPLATKEKISSGYGMRIHPIEKVEKFHRGIDIPAPLGTPVLSTADGEIIETGYTKNYGNYIVIKHDEIYSSKYSQLSKINVEEGDLIGKGEIVGLVGSSGRSTAPHLHFEVTASGKTVDPEKYIKV